MRMELRNTPDRYGAVAQMFHWTIVALLVAQFTIGFWAEDLPTGLRKLVWLTRHKQLGLTIFGLALLRLGWRWFNPVPALPGDLKTPLRWLARGTHVLLYALILVMPVVGWAVSSAGNHPVSYFGAFTLPNIVEPDEGLKDRLAETHEALAWVLLTTALVHASAALWHHFRRGDDVLLRMLPLPGRKDA